MSLLYDDEPQAVDDNSDAIATKRLKRGSLLRDEPLTESAESKILKPIDATRRSLVRGSGELALEGPEFVNEIARIATSGKRGEYDPRTVERAQILNQARAELPQRMNLGGVTGFLTEDLPEMVPQWGAAVAQPELAPLIFGAQMGAAGSRRAAQAGATAGQQAANLAAQTGIGVAGGKYLGKIFKGVPNGALTRMGLSGATNAAMGEAGQVSDKLTFDEKLPWFDAEQSAKQLVMGAVLEGLPEAARRFNVPGVGSTATINPEGGFAQFRRAPKAAGGEKLTMEEFEKNVPPVKLPSDEPLVFEIGADGRLIEEPQQLIAPRRETPAGEAFIAARTPLRFRKPFNEYPGEPGDVARKQRATARMGEPVPVRPEWQSARDKAMTELEAMAQEQQPLDFIDPAGNQQTEGLPATTGSPSPEAAPYGRYESTSLANRPQPTMRQKFAHWKDLATQSNFSRRTKFVGRELLSDVQQQGSGAKIEDVIKNDLAPEFRKFELNRDERKLFDDYLKARDDLHDANVNGKSIPEGRRVAAETTIAKVEDHARRKELEAAAGRIDDVVQGTLQGLADQGVVPQKMVDFLHEKYPHYSPRMRLPELPKEYRTSKPGKDKLFGQRTEWAGNAPEINSKEALAAHIKKLIDWGDTQRAEHDFLQAANEVHPEAVRRLEGPELAAEKKAAGDQFYRMAKQQGWSDAETRLARKNLANDDLSTMMQVFFGQFKPQQSGVHAYWTPEGIEYYRVAPEVESFMKRSSPPVVNAFGKITGFISALFRSGIVNAPLFPLRVGQKHAQFAAVVSEGKGLKVPIVSGSWELIKEKLGRPNYAGEARRLGAVSELPFEFSHNELPKTMKQMTLPRVSEQTGLADKLEAAGKKGLYYVTHPATPAKMALKFLNSTPRIGEYTILMQEAVKQIAKERGLTPEQTHELVLDTPEQMQKAITAAHEIALRYYKASNLLRTLNKGLPFTTTHLMSTAQMARSFKRRPLATIGKGLLFVTTGAVVEWALHHKDKEWQEKPTISKERNYQIGKWQAGSPFQMGTIFKAGPQHLLERYIDQQPVDWGEYLLDGISEMGALGLTSSPLAVPFELATNQEFRTGRPIFYGNQDKTLPEDQANATTGPTARMVGGQAGKLPVVGKYLTPANLDYLIHKTPIVSDVGTLSDKALDKAGKRFGAAPQFALHGKSPILGMIESSEPTIHSAASVQRLRTKMNELQAKMNGYTKRKEMVPVNLKFEYNTTKKKWDRYNEWLKKYRDLTARFNKGLLSKQELKAQLANSEQNAIEAAR